MCSHQTASLSIYLSIWTVIIQIKLYSPHECFSRQTWKRTKGKQSAARGDKVNVCSLHVTSGITGCLSFLAPWEPLYSCLAWQHRSFIPLYLSVFQQRSWQLHGFWEAARWTTLPAHMMACWVEAFPRDTIHLRPLWRLSACSPDHHVSLIVVRLCANACHTLAAHRWFSWRSVKTFTVSGPRGSRALQSWLHLCLILDGEGWIVWSF